MHEIRTGLADHLLGMVAKRPDRTGGIDDRPASAKQRYVRVPGEFRPSNPATRRRPPRLPQGAYDASYNRVYAVREPVDGSVDTIVQLAAYYVFHPSLEFHGPMPALHPSR